MKGRARRSGRSSDARPLPGRPQHRGAEPGHAPALGGAGASAGKTPRDECAHAPSHDPFAGSSPRFILDDPGTRPDVDAADDDWTSLINQRCRTPPGTGESARVRFDAYLETLQRAVDLEEQIAVYGEASRNRDIVARVTAAVASSARDRLFTGFNTPLVPEVLIVTTSGQEGINLHRECRHVIHHDLPWNPATLEQRTGRVDRIGSKIERPRETGNGIAPLMSPSPTSRVPMTSIASAWCTGALASSMSRWAASTSWTPQDRFRCDGGRKPQ